jgi:hypothetical protein
VFSKTIVKKGQVDVISSLKTEQVKAMHDYCNLENLLVGLPGVMFPGWALLDTGPYGRLVCGALCVLLVSAIAA